MSRPWILIVMAALFATVSMVAARETTSAQQFALLVGVTDYDAAGFAKLRYTERDVEELGKILTKAGYQVRILSASRGVVDKASVPTKANIERELKALMSKKTRRDTLLFAFSGHGLQETIEKKDECFLCPSDAQANDNATWVSLSKLYEDLDACGAGAKLLLIDACRDRPKGRKSLNLGALPQVPKGMGVLFSCKADERSFELPALEHGVFFHFVLKGLRGEAKLEDDGELTWNNLASYVTRQVSRESPRLIGAAGRQTPEQDSRFTGESPVLLVDKIEIQVSTLKMTMRRIPKGTFRMGPTESDLANFNKLKTKPGSLEGPQREVRIGEAKAFQGKRFYMGKYEVTQGEFKTIMGYNPSYFSTDAKGDRGTYLKGSEPAGGAALVKALTPAQRDRLPVENVSQEEAVRFCEKLTEMEKKAGSAIVYRLPTEAEWEYACRAGTTTAYHFGEAITINDVVFNGKFASSPKAKELGVAETPVPVDDARFQSKANRFGLVHMHGNIREWCSDWQGKIDVSQSSDPEGPKTGTLKIVRGGSWYSDAFGCHSSLRLSFAPGHRYQYAGFRVVCLVP
jgi:formylglycine-generating enzyme required for sulfatase activity